MRVDYSSVTEVAGRRATPEQLSMIQTRYGEAAMQATGKRVLEVACGPGRGLGIIAHRARFMVGGDYSFPLASHLEFTPFDIHTVVLMKSQPLR